MRDDHVSGLHDDGKVDGRTLAMRVRRLLDGSVIKRASEEVAVCGRDDASGINSCLTLFCDNGKWKGIGMVNARSRRSFVRSLQRSQDVIVPLAGDEQPNVSPTIAANKGDVNDQLRLSL